MPRVKFDYVVSFSSEDPEHPASNLLSTEVSKKKWLCKTGESSCSVVLGVTRAIRVSSLTVGAHMTALVEVLVGRSETPDEPFKVLVASSVFLNPLESRRGDTGAGGARVRSFPHDVLCEGTRDQAWDRVRLVCSQPYNRHAQFGLSFVHILSAEEVAPRPAPVTFSLDARSDDDESFTPGELFRTQRISDTGSDIRRASADALRNRPQPSTRLVKTPIVKDKARTFTKPEENSSFTDRKRDDLMYTEEDATPHKKIDSVLENHERHKRRHEEAKDNKESKVDTTESNKPEKRKLDDAKPKDTPKKHKSDDTKKERRNSSSGDKPFRDNKDNPAGDSSTKKDHKHKKHKSRDRSPNKAVMGPRSRSPHRLLRGVVVVLSGYQNPERATLRDLAQALGARYLPAWGDSATHLICAFPNTPKMREVRARCRTAATCTGDWLRAVSRRRRVLPWTWYHTDPKLREPHDSGDDEEEEDEAEEGRAPSPAPTDDRRADKDEDTDDEIERVLQRQRRDTAAPAADSARPARGATNDDEDTDDEIEKVIQRPARADSPPDDDATDEEAEGARAAVLRRALPRPLAGLVAGVAGAGPGAATVARYLTAYGADVTDLSREESAPDVVVCVDADCGRHREGVHVTPDWLWSCHSTGSRPPYDKFALH